MVGYHRSPGQVTIRGGAIGHQQDGLPHIWLL